MQKNVGQLTKAIAISLTLLLLTPWVLLAFSFEQGGFAGSPTGKFYALADSAMWTALISPSIIGVGVVIYAVRARVAPVAFAARLLKALLLLIGIISIIAGVSITVWAVSNIERSQEIKSTQKAHEAALERGCIPKPNFSYGISPYADRYAYYIRKSDKKFVNLINSEAEKTEEDCFSGKITPEQQKVMSERYLERLRDRLVEIGGQQLLQKANSEVVE